MEWTALVARIVARYLAGAMMTAGFLTPELAESVGADPDVIGLIGLGLGGLVEIGYAIAKKKGWAT